MVYPTVPGPKYAVPDHQDAQLMPLVPDEPGTGVASRVPESDDVERSRVNPAGVGTSALSLIPVNGAGWCPGDPRRARAGEQQVTATLTMAAESRTALTRQAMRRLLAVVDYVRNAQRDLIPVCG
jgi:hypothetical protein